MSNVDILLGAFVAAPAGGLLWAFGASGLRVGSQWLLARLQGYRFDALLRHPPSTQPFLGRNEDGNTGTVGVDSPDQGTPQLKGSFF